jgi:CIC family chloride channel protein
MAIAGVLFYVLMAAFGHYYTEGVGYATIQDILTGWKQPVLLLVLLCGAKLLATGLTLGSGASGGIFSPALFMGATLGSAYGFLLARIFPAAGIDAQAFAVAGMAGLIGGSTGAALAAIVMIFEMTLDYNVIIPMTLTVAIAYEVRKRLSRESIYTFKLVRRGHHMPESLGTNAHFFRPVRDLMNTRIAVVAASLSPADFAQKAAEQPEVEYFLMDGSGKIAAVCPRGQEPVKKFSALPEDMTLVDGLGRLHRANAALALVSVHGETATASVKGVITRQQVADALAEAIERYDDDVCG